MRIIKTLVLLIIGMCLVVIGVGNMAPVDLYLVPPKVAPGSEFSLKSIPLAAVIMASVLLGLVIGQILEWVREGKHRRVSNDRGRELARMRNELAQVKTKVTDVDDDLPNIPVR
ncbi:MAG: LapA family protein [Pseudomonadota bacterium]